ncbi:hypothetical protein IFM89_018598 [Coptis chinensis]|uniref:RNase H type-1 domain-containing protein n=1 Tax=Coptis chinensis TaxID=261450 RepID=A0A835I3C1_9MAGN|nr:hypothetical protein IFM89_018598 [Coptis chinensis]
MSKHRSVLIQEMQGIEAGLQAAKSLTQHLIVNSDSARAINIINGIESTPWYCQYLLPTIKGHCGSFRSIVFQHIYREGKLFAEEKGTLSRIGSNGKDKDNQQTR